MPDTGSVDHERRRRAITASETTQPAAKSRQLLYRTLRVRQETREREHWPEPRDPKSDAFYLLTLRRPVVPAIGDLAIVLAAHPAIIVYGSRH
jgi:hypothetical protein